MSYDIMAIKILTRVCVCVGVCSTNVPLFRAKVSNDHSIQQKAKPKQKCLRLTLEVQDQVFWLMYSICFILVTCDIHRNSLYV